jgi:hypothetical protein
MSTLWQLLKGGNPKAGLAPLKGLLNNFYMPLQHVLEECIAIQRNLREPDLDLDFIVQHAESLLRHARLAQEGATYAGTSDRDRARVRAAFLNKITKAPVLQTR